MKDKNIIEKTVDSVWKFYQGRSENTRKMIAQRILPVGAIVLAIFAFITYGFYNSYTAANAEGYYHYTFAQKIKYSFVSGVALTIGVSFWVILVPYLIFLFTRKKPMESTAHGSARFISNDELEKHGILRESPLFRPHKFGSKEITVGDYLESGGFAIGRKFRTEQKKNSPAYFGVALPAKRTARHLGIFGTSGSGKTESLLITNIRFTSPADSLFISDVKGELWKKTAGYPGQKPIYFSPLEPDKNMLKFNWIPLIKDDPTLAKQFADAVVINGGGDQFWSDSAARLLAAVWLHTATTDLPNPVNAYRILTSDLETLKWILENSPSYRAQRMASQLFGNDKTAEGIMSSAQLGFSFMDSPAIQEFCWTNQATDFTFLRKGNFRLYYQAREDKVKLLKALNSLIFTYMSNQLEATEGSTIKFIMEEFANFGQIPDLENKITLWRDKKMPMILALQTLRSQLETIYGRERTATILDGLHFHMAFGGLSQSDGEEISKGLGVTTNVSQVRQDDGNNNTQLNARPLMTSDEVRRTAEDNIIVFKAGELHPFVVDRFPMEDHRGIDIDWLWNEYKIKRRLVPEEMDKPIKKPAQPKAPAKPKAAKQDQPPTLPPPSPVATMPTMPEEPEMPEDNWDDLVFPGDGNIN
jgi:type IV secretory pathway TraG/TraD family ATPase VirD4